MRIDDLIVKIKDTKCPVCLGLDTAYEYLPEGFLKSGGNAFKKAAAGIFDFNKGIIDATCDLIPSVKVQVAYYEKYGVSGMQAFFDTIEYAKKKGLIAIADIKRNDIGATATAYANAYLDGTDIDGEDVLAFDADFITVNAYLGADGIKPFIDACKKTGKGLFCLVKTSNPSSGEFQDLTVNGKHLYELVGEKVSEWGKDLIGKYGFSSVGAVVGATYPKQASELRKLMPKSFFLIPGYGAQGASADDIVASFDKDGLGGIINSSRAILLAYRKDKYPNLSFDKAARQAVIDMREDILSSFNKNKINL
ncbi:MAG: orotidine-5'-phosphate decarboxylase [Eubacteriales bacterium]